MGARKYVRDIKYMLLAVSCATVKAKGEHICGDGGCDQGSCNVYELQIVGEAMQEEMHDTSAAVLNTTKKRFRK